MTDDGRGRAQPAPSSLIIVGLGNPLLGDDGFGWRVVEQVEQRLTEVSSQGIPYGKVVCERLSLGGLSLMERLVGFRKAILVDALSSGQHPPGTLLTFRLEDLPPSARSYTRSAHDVSLREAFAMGRLLGADLPTEVTIVAAEAEAVFEFREDLSPAVAAAVPQATQRVLDLITQEAADDLT